jgi:hypothetical protein
MLEALTDSYDRKARLYPALLLISPIIALLIAAISVKYSAMQAFAAGAAACGGAFLLTQLARDAGKKREPQLFEAWGGLPSIAVFRHSDRRFDSITKTRYHVAMASLLKGTKPPTEQQEGADPAAADAVYSAWSNYLRTHTRDQKRFALLFKENINYGYRRNVFGLRPAGVLVCIAVGAIAMLRVWTVYQSTRAIDQMMLAAAIFSMLLLLLWIFRFTDDWVRVPADAYAHRLIEAIDTLVSAKQSSKK